MIRFKFNPWIYAIAAGFVVPLSASADQETTITTTTTSTDVAPNTILVPSAVTTERRTVIMSSTVPLNVTEAPFILQTVDVRRTELDKQIIAARDAGTLSEAQSADLRRELDRIGSEVAFLKQQQNPSLIRTIVLGRDLDALTTRARGSVTTITFVPIIEGSHFTVYNGKVVELDDLAVRRIELENRILAAQSCGKIDFDQANHMRSQLNAIASLEDAYSSQGAINVKHSREIYTEMDKVANELDRDIR